jgi:SAM-dependent methyltransferase
MRTVQRDWDWWAYHFRVVHRGQIPGIDQWDDDLVDMILEVLKLQPGDRVLDLACGSGAHALRLARRGLGVLGVDVAPSLVAHCRRQAAEGGIASPRFEEGDMRDLDLQDEFDAVLLLSGSFGFFDDATNRDVLARMARALRSAEPVEPGAPATVCRKRRGNDRAALPGRILIDVFDPAEMVTRPPRRSWSQNGGGYGLQKTWWEPQTCTYVSEFMFHDAGGVLNTSAEPERIRVYSLPEWRDLFAAAGLILTHALADTKLPLVAYDQDHYSNLVIVGHRNTDLAPSAPLAEGS